LEEIMEQIIRSTSPIDANLAASLIREAKSAAFKSRAIGIGAAIGIPGLALSLGAAAILWAHNHSVDPEMLKAALANMPALKVEGTVKADGEVKMAEGATVKLQDGSTVKLADGSVVTVKGTIPGQTQPPIVLPTLKPEENQAIKTTVTVFKTLPHGDGEVTSGWRFASGDAKSPMEQYCYYRQKAGVETATQQNIAKGGVISFAPKVAPAEQAARFQKCQWWQGSL
jgi:hypothetical protein